MDVGDEFDLHVFDGPSEAEMFWAFGGVAELTAAKSYGWFEFTHAAGREGERERRAEIKMSRTFFILFFLSS